MSNFLHLFFAIVTLGLWLLVWIPLIVFRGERHMRVSVDERGGVTSTRPSRKPPQRELADAAAANNAGV